MDNGRKGRGRLGETDPGMTEPLVSLSGISRGFTSFGNRVQVLEKVDCDIYPGDTVAVVGASGIGKSTLLHVLGTLDRPDEGELLFRGENVLEFDDERLAAFRNRSVGFVFQFHHLLSEFSTLENVMMPLLVGGMEKGAAGKAAERILDRVGLSDRLSNLVGELSGGQQQRVALARALAPEPLILLADEPTGNLDEKNSEQIHELLTELNRELSMTMVVVTHNMDLAALMSRRVTLVDRRLRVKTNTG